MEAKIDSIPEEWRAVALERTGYTSAMRRQEHLDEQAERLARAALFATADLRKRQAVLAHRAETARLRRAKHREQEGHREPEA